ncbi:hypothetical protein OBO34_15415 [Clostridiales Family XIII bacterium ASD5510]|uniref:HD domain-containing protein n=1 Tax=Hominibacterium faecale TaxID=2839743 RepID=A0A9J6QWG6_9FIRM|nr:hypothetical protein [Hominibacterium faecale]MCU7379734.1 hypothetical protein [Hominibacterium faecale]
MNKHAEVRERIMAAKLTEYLGVIMPWLDDIGYFTAPSSHRYHGAYYGGNCEHSLAVCDKLVWLTKRLDLKWTLPRSPYIVGLFHDLCKCDAYVKTEEGFDYNPDMLITGHGEKSVMLLSNVLTLTEEEILCIRYHMGAYEQSDWHEFDLAIKKYPNVLFTHTADMLASKLEV